VQNIKLFQQLNQRSLSEWVVNTGLESEGGSGFGQIFDPFLSDGSGDQIALIQDKDEVLVGALSLQVLLNELGSGPIGVSSI